MTLNAMLHTTTLGGGGSPVVFCHGLFGQGKNWTTIAKALADEHRVVLVDMPDHGQSPWSERFDYVAAADQVAALLSADDPVALVGHSMGGKIAMLVALRHPELVARLDGRGRRARGLRRTPRSSPATSPRCGPSTSTTLERRGDADEALARRRAEPDGARVPAPEPAPRGRLLELAAEPRAARPRPGRDHRLAGGAARPAPRRTTGRCCGSAASGRRTCRPSTWRRWTGGSRATAG